MGWSILTGISACQLAMVFVIQWLVTREKSRAQGQQQQTDYVDDSRHHADVESRAVASEVGADTPSTVREETKL